MRLRINYCHFIIAVFFSLLLSNCTLPKNSRLNKTFFDIQGHRGCRGLMPENTIAGFIKAIDEGVTTLEMDVVITKDGYAIVSHEPFFNHEITTKANGNFVKESEEKQLNIYAMNYTDLLQYDVGLKPHPRFPNQHKVAATKPLLSNVIELVEIYTKAKGLPAMRYNIETKCNPSTDGVFHPAPQAFVSILMKVIEQYKVAARTTIQSFDVRTLQVMHQQFPAVQTAYLYEGISLSSLDVKLEKLGFTPTIYSPAYQLVTKQLVKKCHAKGMQIIPWTVNDSASIKRLMNIGVDGIITDYPNLFKSLATSK